MRVLKYTDRPDIILANNLIKNYTSMGIFINIDRLSRLEETTKARISQLENQIYQLAGEKFNYNSTAQYAYTLINKFGVEPRLITRNGDYSVNKEVLAEVQKVMDIPVIQLVNECKSLKKTLSAIDGPKGIRKYLIKSTLFTEDGDKIGIVVPDISKSETGRYQFSNPSIGNLAPELMEMFCAPDGYVLISLDVKQQEPTILTNGVLNSPHFKQLFKEDKEDKYIAVTKFCLAQDELVNKIEHSLEVVPQITETDWAWNFLKLDEVTGLPMRHKNKYLLDYTKINDYIMQHTIADVEYTKEDRNGYKVALLSGSYGAYEASITKRVGEKIGSSFYRMFSTLPEMVYYKELARQYLLSDADINKEVYTLFGTRLPIKDYDSQGKRRNLDAKLRCMINYPTQGTGADMLKFAICDFYNWAKSKDLKPRDARILTTRHDELVVMIRKDLLHYLDEIKGLVELQVEDWAPILVDVKYGTHYTK